MQHQLPADAAERTRPAETAERTWGLMALAVGGLLLSRMVASDKTAGEILESCRGAAATLSKSSVRRKGNAVRTRSKNRPTVKRTAKATMKPTVKRV